MPSAAFHLIQNIFIYIFKLFLWEISLCRDVRHRQPHDLHLPVDGSPEGVAGGAKKHARVNVLEHDGLVRGNVGNGDRVVDMESNRVRYSSIK